ncbi:uncharacterized protein [Drosophila virilis]|uniref:Single domain-containing protein n=1 Tax=Drosophila virilis TaxID=7244 RepID=B4LT73_DROVI|nr:uncharacterized protein LOC6629018 [Drosophila virilis]EDW64915.2 uncharacterized protein Dvir_GJ19985 [Drosophila virilis]
MHLLILFKLIAYFTLGLQAAEWVGIYYNEKYPGKCVISSELILNEGASIKDPTHECRQIVCGSHGSTIFQSCGIISGLPTTCRFGSFINMDLPYPHCCERTIICS